MALRDVFDKIRGRLPADFLFVGERLTAATAQTMIEKAPTGDTKRAISVKSVAMSGNAVVGTIEIDLNTAPEALAYEYGSGIHSEKGEKYPIPKDEATRNQPFLVFAWEKAYPHIRRTKDGKVVLKRVMHPGVAARPYIEPSLDELKKTVKDVISVQIKKGLSAAFNEAGKE